MGAEYICCADMAAVFDFLPVLFFLSVEEETVGAATGIVIPDIRACCCC